MLSACVFYCSPRAVSGSSFRPVPGPVPQGHFPQGHVPQEHVSHGHVPQEHGLSQGHVPQMVSVGVQFSGTCHNLLQVVRQDNQEL
jgi:hypothetical protein